MPVTWHDVVALHDEYNARCGRQPFQLGTLRGWARELERLVDDAPHLLKMALEQVGRLTSPFYPLPETLELERRIQALDTGTIEEQTYRHRRIMSVYGLGTWWLEPLGRYHYGDPRLLRPWIAEVLVELEGWPIPLPEEYAQLGVWYEELAPGGALYPSDEHLLYVERFEWFADKIVWDWREPLRLTITNFPPPPGCPPPTDRLSTHHRMPATGPRAQTE